LIAGDPHRAAIKLLANLTQREALVLTSLDQATAQRSHIFIVAARDIGWLT
jgi:hypothetical protein